MNKATSKDIDTLTGTTAHNCITLYVPTHAGPTNQQTDAIVFKNVIKKLNKVLNAQELDNNQKAKIVADIDQALSHELLSRKDGSLALFHDTETLRGYYIKDIIEPMVTAGPKFHILPLRVSKLTNVSFVIVSLSQETVDIFECTSTTINRLPTGSYQAESLYKELNLDEIIKTVQTHPSQKGSSSNSFGFHGQGAFKAQHKDLIKRYFREVDSNIAPIVNKTDLKVVLAGVEYLIPIYKEVTKIKHIQSESLQGNFQKTPDDELLAQAKKILEP